MRAFIFLLLFLLTMAANGQDRCLIDYPEVQPKKFVHLEGRSLNITLQVSNRITHQVNTQIFYIFLKEVLGYAKVEIIHDEDHFNMEYVIDKLTDITSIVPKAMINLEVWVPPESNDPSITFIEEAGSIGSPGRFGWYIPVNLSHPLKKFYKPFTYDSNEIHWSYFKDAKAVSVFELDSTVLHTLDQYARVHSESKDYFCDSPTCDKGIYTPTQCKKGKHCALLLAPDFNSTNFVIDHINEMQLLVRVIFVGPNLGKVINYLTSYVQSLGDKSILILNWTPSDIILRETDFINVAFKHCGLLNSSRSNGCRYELHRLVKFAWSKVETFAKPLYDALRSYKFEEEVYRHLVEMYRRNPNVSEVACEFMRKNKNLWTSWKTKAQSTNKIYIGGIFPISDSSYEGKGIARAALMAKDAINRNSSILPHYQLELLVTDGKCSADTVMRNFIDFIIQNVYKNLIGVLGPACSDTVEPLAGVSRHYHIMVISYSAEGASFSNRDKYPYFFRTIGENQHYKHVYLALFKQFRWRRVASLTEDGQKYTEYISSMQDDLERNNISFIANKKFPREREMEAMARYLEDLKGKRARIIIADVVDEVARNVMCEAYHLQMTAAHGYVWFLPMWLNATWFDTDYFNKERYESVNCSTAQMIEAVRGYFSMTHAFFANDSQMMQENITVGEWRRKYEMEINNHSATSSNYAGFAYDAVWTYAYAIDKLSRTAAGQEALADIHSERTTNQLVKMVEATDFEGVSGRIKFRGGPSRFSVIHIMEWYDYKMNIIGSFTLNVTDDYHPEIHGGELHLNSSAIRWFTPNNRTPVDGTLPPEKCVLQGLADALNVECQSALIILNVLVALLLFFGLVVIGWFMRRSYAKKVQEAKLKYKRFDDAINGLDKWEVIREKVVINRKLGEGAFGTVYGGEAELPDTNGWQAVAVKTLKPGSSTEEKLDFLSEAETMKRFDHKNIVKLLGVCTKDEPVYTIMEFMLYGDLKTFLLARRHLVNVKNPDESDEVSRSRLTSMALDVARGLSYLAEMKYVHRDVASRNCLVNAQRVVKLGDFGMTRMIFDNDYYKFTRKGMLPVRWMSPESLALGIFTPASDVWSYGVLLYEIITFGSFPFQGKSNSQVLELVKNGHTLQIPQGVKTQLEGLIKSCWQIESKNRPSASEIVEFLANNPKLLAPCLDVPLSSVEIDASNQCPLLPSDLRKSSTASHRTSPAKPNGVLPNSVTTPTYNEPQLITSNQNDENTANVYVDTTVGGAAAAVSGTNADMPHMDEIGGSSCIPMECVNQPLLGGVSPSKRKYRNEDDYVGMIMKDDTIV